MTLCTTTHLTRQEDPGRWIGGEAAVGAQAERHVRSQERNIRGLAMTVLGLAFLGGFTLAGAICRLTGRGARRQE